MELSKVIKSIQVLNIDDSESTIKVDQLPKCGSIKDIKSFIVSDADEELIILIEFSQIIDLNSIKVYVS